jgi:3-deoxy-manno-octulosonate cytidylyltransferase (CMP-KDO synthetase)
MDFVVIIPARYASTRLPGKPLRDIKGLPMIQRVWQQACKSSASQVIIATDDKRIEEVAVGFGARVCMTKSDHQSGTDRLWEVAEKLDFDENQIVVNVQGDEPLIPPEVIDQVADNLIANQQAGVSTLCEPIERVEDFLNPNVVKLLVDHSNMAIYFSRAPIPWPREGLSGENCFPEMARRHIGIYGYRVGCLKYFVSCPVSPPEQLESLEQLRFLYNGVDIHVADSIVDVPAGVDTEEDLQDIINSI